MKSIVVSDIEVIVEGPENAQTLLFLHGWPNDRSLWDATVAELKADYCCARLTLPGFDPAQAPRTMSHKEITAFLRDVVETLVGKNGQVVLVLHDWGCIFGYEFAMQHAELVSGVIGIDIGDHNSPHFVDSLSVKAKALIGAYQSILVLAYLLKGAAGNALASQLTKVIDVPAAFRQTGWQMAYPYAMRWLGVAGGLADLEQINIQTPFLYMYGANKPFFFHSDNWTQSIEQKQKSNVIGYANSGHWVMVDAFDEYMTDIKSWLAALYNKFV